MEIWFVSFIGGFVGSFFMDLTEEKMAKYGISSGVTGAYIGRWVIGLRKGVFVHANIKNTKPVKNEIRIGQVTCPPDIVQFQSEGCIMLPVS